MKLIYFLTKDCKNSDNKNYVEYYVYDKTHDRLFCHLSGFNFEIFGQQKEKVLNETKTVVSKENCLDSDFIRR